MWRDLISFVAGVVAGLWNSSGSPSSCPRRYAQPRAIEFTETGYSSLKIDVTRV